MTEQEIHVICKKYNIQNYSINLDGSIDVDGNVVISDIVLGNVKSPNIIEKMPLKFNMVSGDFYCNWNKLTTLENSPGYVGGNFYCIGNELKNLIGIGIVNGENILCDGNPLESFEGYNGDLSKLYFLNKNKLIRKTKLKLIDQL